MSLIIVETSVEQPMTDEILLDEDKRAAPCLAARNIAWRYSLLSSDRYRMICTFDAPDAESVRDAYRKAGLHARPTWASNFIQIETTQPSGNLTYIMEGTYPTLSETDWDTISSKILSYCAACEVQWLCSYLSLDRTKVIYELSASDIEPIQEAPHKLGMPFDRVWSAQILSP